jgi:hypothetical protein
MLNALFPKDLIEESCAEQLGVGNDGFGRSNPTRLKNLAPLGEPDILSTMSSYVRADAFGIKPDLLQYTALPVLKVMQHQGGGTRSCQFHYLVQKDIPGTGIHSGVIERTEKP